MILQIRIVVGWVYESETKSLIQENYLAPSPRLLCWNINWILCLLLLSFYLEGSCFPETITQSSSNHVKWPLGHGWSYKPTSGRWWRVSADLLASHLSLTSAGREDLDSCGAGRWKQCQELWETCGKSNSISSLDLGEDTESPGHEGGSLQALGVSVSSPGLMTYGRQPTYRAFYLEHFGQKKILCARRWLFAWSFQCQFSYYSLHQ